MHAILTKFLSHLIKGIWLLASLNTHETTKGVRLKFTDVECFRDYVTEESEEAYDTKAAFSVWIPASETKVQEKVVKPSATNQPDVGTDYYADMLGLRTLRNQGNSTTDVEQLDLSFLDHDEGVLLEDLSPSLTGEIQSTTNPELGHSKQNQTDLVLSEDFEDKNHTKKGVQNETILGSSLTDDIMMNSTLGNRMTDEEKLDLSLVNLDDGALLEDSNQTLTGEMRNTTDPELGHSKQNQSSLILSEDFDDENHTSKHVQNETMLSFSVADDVMINSTSGNQTTDLEKLNLSLLDLDEVALLEDSNLTLASEIQNTTNPDLEHFEQNQSDLISSDGFDHENHTEKHSRNETMLSFGVTDTVMHNSSINSSSNSSTMKLLQDTDKNQTSQNSNKTSLTETEAMLLLSNQTSESHGENATEVQIMDITVETFIYSEPAPESPTSITEIQATEDFVLLVGGDQTEIMSKAIEVEYNISPPGLPDNTTVEQLGNTTQNITHEKVQEVNDTGVSSRLLNETIQELNSTQVDSVLKKLNSTEHLKTEGSSFSTGTLVLSSSSEESSEEESREEVVIYLKNNKTEGILTSPLDAQRENWSYESKHELVPMEISDHIKKYITDDPEVQANRSSIAKKEKKIVLKRVTPLKGYGMKTKKRIDYKPQPRSALSPRGFSPRGFGPTGLSPRGTRPVSSEENLLGKSIVIGVPRNDFNDYELYVHKQGNDYDFDTIPDHTEEYEYVEYKDPYRKQGDVQSVVLDEASKYSLQMAGSKARAYFISAEEVDWDYGGYGQRYCLFTVNT